MRKNNFPKTKKKYFVNVGPNLAAKITDSEKHFSDYLIDNNDI